MSGAEICANEIATEAEQLRAKRKEWRAVNRNRLWDIAFPNKEVDKRLDIVRDAKDDPRELEAHKILLTEYLAEPLNTTLPLVEALICGWRKRFSHPDPFCRHRAFTLFDGRREAHYRKGYIDLHDVPPEVLLQRNKMRHCETHGTIIPQSMRSSSHSARRNYGHVQQREDGTRRFKPASEGSADPVDSEISVQTGYGSNEDNIPNNRKYDENGGKLWYANMACNNIDDRVTPLDVWHTEEMEGVSYLSLALHEQQQLMKKGRPSIEVLAPTPDDAGPVLDMDGQPLAIGDVVVLGKGSGAHYESSSRRTVTKIEYWGYTTDRNVAKRAFGAEPGYYLHFANHGGRDEPIRNVIACRKVDLTAKRAFTHVEATPTPTPCNSPESAPDTHNDKKSKVIVPESPLL